MAWCRQPEAIVTQICVGKCITRLQWVKKETTFVWFSIRWDGTGSWILFSCETKIHVAYGINSWCPGDARNQGSSNNLAAIIPKYCGPSTKRVNNIICWCLSVGLRNNKAILRDRKVLINHMFVKWYNSLPIYIIKCLELFRWKTTKTSTPCIWLILIDPWNSYSVANVWLKLCIIRWCEVCNHVCGSLDTYGCVTNRAGQLTISNRDCVT